MRTTILEIIWSEERFVQKTKTQTPNVFTSMTTQSDKHLLSSDAQRLTPTRIYIYRVISFVEIKSTFEINSVIIVRGRAAFPPEAAAAPASGKCVEQRWMRKT